MDNSYSEVTAESSVTITSKASRGITLAVCVEGATVMRQKLVTKRVSSPKDD